MSERALLTTYLNDHLTGATAGVELFRRAARSHRGTDVGRELTALTLEVEEDREDLRQIMARLEVPASRVRATLGVVGERLGRLKPNGSLLRRSPLTDVVEVEGLRAAVAGKQAGWQVLRTLAADDPRLDPSELEALDARADRQATRLKELHLGLADRRLRARVG